MGRWMMLALALLAGGARAEAPAFPDFTFKSTKPPVAGQKRITVRIGGPAETPAAPLVAVPASAPPAPAAAPGFWAAVSPDRSAASPARLGAAIEASRGQAPRLAALQRIVDAHAREILAATVGTRISPAFVLAVIYAESGGRVAVESSAGAVGLMQLMPATAARFGVTDRTSAAQNIKGGVRYLDHLWGLYEGDPVLMLAAYNAGEGAVAKAGGVPNYRETRGYVPKVIAAFAVARGLCLTPPELISDGCVFRTSD